MNDDKIKKVGDKISNIGCILTILITLPIVVILLLVMCSR